MKKQTSEITLTWLQNGFIHPGKQVGLFLVISFSTSQSTIRPSFFFPSSQFLLLSFIFFCSEEGHTEFPTSQGLPKEHTWTFVWVPLSTRHQSQECGACCHYAWLDLVMSSLPFFKGVCARVRACSHMLLVIPTCFMFTHVSKSALKCQNYYPRFVPLLGCCGRQTDLGTPALLNHVICLFASDFTWIYLT